MEKRKDEYEERKRTKKWDGEKKGRIQGKDQDKKNEMETRKEEYEERTRINRMRWRKERKNTRKGQG